MLLAEVGLPPGIDVDRASLSKLLDDWTISRYELQPDRIVFYLWSGRAEGTHFRFRITPRYAIHAKAAPSTLLDYYNPDLKVVLAPQTFTVGVAAPTIPVAAMEGIGLTNSRLSAVMSCRECGRTCEYASSVNATEACPSSSLTIFGDTPTDKARVWERCISNHGRCPRSEMWTVDSRFE